MSVIDVATFLMACVVLYKKNNKEIVFGGFYPIADIITFMSHALYSDELQNVLRLSHLTLLSFDSSVI